jgi:hypothetical protein
MGRVSTRDDLLSGEHRSPAEVTRVISPGLYAWWDDEQALPWPAGFPSVDQRLPVYVGIAASQSLGARFEKNHLARTRGSGLRRSLVGLVVGQLGLEPHLVLNDASRPSKFTLDEEGEKCLTAWMLEHLRVTWVEMAHPGRAEEALIASLVPPLNDIHATGSPYRAAMRAVRQRAAFSARR